MPAARTLHTVHPTTLTARLGRPRPSAWFKFTLPPFSQAIQYPVGFHYPCYTGSTPSEYTNTQSTRQLKPMVHGDETNNRHSPLFPSDETNNRYLPIRNSTPGNTAHQSRYHPLLRRTVGLQGQGFSEPRRSRGQGIKEQWTEPVWLGACYTSLELATDTQSRKDQYAQAVWYGVTGRGSSRGEWNETAGKEAFD